MEISSFRAGRLRAFGLSCLAALSITSYADMSAPTNATAAKWIPVSAPAELNAARAQWIKIDTSSGHKLLAAVFRPQGPGPFPIVVVLHGSAGLQSSQLALAEDIARAGLIALVGCWQLIASPPARAQNPVCSEAPPQSLWEADPAKHSGKELIAAARTLPHVRTERVGLYGLSRGGNAALWAASTGSQVQAIVVDAPAHQPTRVEPAPPSTLTVVAGLSAPTLMLHGTADRLVPVEQSREYESAAQALGKPVIALFFEGMGHQVTAPHVGTEPQALADARNKMEPEARRQAIAFLREHLTRP